MKHNSFNKSEDVHPLFIFHFKIWYFIRALWRHFRIHKVTTKIIGRQYKRSRDKIEIDITYLCNLYCNNCNRSVSQAPQGLHISLSHIDQFVDISLKRAIKWKRIRILGGEPTLHPEFLEIITSLLKYKNKYPLCIIEVVSNGYGDFVKKQLNKLPVEVYVDNSYKNSNVQPHFGPFNMAPIDDKKYQNVNFKNGCEIIEKCGMGLTPLGYYPCAVAGGIDRIIKKKLGYSEIPPENDDMEGILERCCKLCGRFRDGHFIPRNLRPNISTQLTSASWANLYREWENSEKA